VNRRYRWHAAAVELAEVVRTAGPRVAVAGIVMVAFAAAPAILRAYTFVPW
jgi:hypothetical protein